MDIDAEREKITKEIKELERILDPGSTSINVEVSESSLESDSDAGKLLSVAGRAVSTFGSCQLSYTAVLLGSGRFSPGLASAFTPLDSLLLSLHYSPPTCWVHASAGLMVGMCIRLSSDKGPGCPPQESESLATPRLKQSPWLRLSPHTPLSSLGSSHCPLSGSPATKAHIRPTYPLPCAPLEPECPSTRLLLEPACMAKLTRAPSLPISSQPWAQL